MSPNEELNAKQKEAVHTIEGPVLVVAGAGAGKTKVITERILHLIRDLRVPPEEILAVTFTNKAAEEMRQRVQNNENVPASTRIAQPFIGTFHALGLLIIKENLKHLGIGKYFTVADEDDTLKLLKESLLDLSLDPKQFDPGRIKNSISRLKDQLYSVDRFLIEAPQSARGSDFFEATLGTVWERYEEKKKAYNMLDFDDLILIPTLFLQKHPDIHAAYTKRWRYIHIDEYQDTNDAQYTLSCILASAHRNILVVGDIDQAIYSWRGANFKNIMRFQEDYPDATTITLEENYRSTHIVLEAANAVIAQNTLRLPKNLWTAQTGGQKIRVIFTENEKKEGAMVAQEIQILHRHAVRYETMAILYRTNAQSRAIEEALLMHNIPYRVIGGMRFYERREVKDLLAYLRFIHNPADTISKKRILNVPPRGIGKTLMLKVLGGIPTLTPQEIKKNALFEDILSSLRAIKDTKTPAQLIKAVVQKIGYRAYIDDGTEKGVERWHNVEELIGVATKTELLEEFLEHVSLFSVDDRVDTDPERRKVNLMTMHTAKGLEFDAVFVVGLEEGLFPHILSFEREQLEEERRLYYVAITRAKTRLYLTLAAERSLFGERTSNMPSRFLKEIPEHLIEYISKPTEIEEDIFVE